MSSDDPQSPRPKLRFKFASRVRPPHHTELSPDEILESLIRRAHSREKLAEDASIALGDGEERLEGPAEPYAYGPGMNAGRRGLGRFAFALMLIGGLVVLWLYGALESILDLSWLNGFTQIPSYESIIYDPFKLALVGFFSFVVLLLVRRRGKVQSLYD